MLEFAFATLVTSDAYAQGAQVIAAALRELHPSPPTPPGLGFETVCLVSPETVDVSTLKALRRAFDVVIGVEVIDEDQIQGLTLLGRPDLGTVLTKLHVFRLTQYSKIIFLDADVLPVRQLSHLFTLPYEFSAVPDVGWPDIFNSGMMVLTPGEDKFQEIRQLVKSRGSWDGGDQGILNEWRGENWHRLSFTYNTTPTAAYTYAPAYERFGSKISVIHFIGPNKPWQSAPWRPPFAPSRSKSAPPAPASPSETQTVASPGAVRQSYAYDQLVDRWFDVYDRHVRPAEAVPVPSFQPGRYEPAWRAPSAAPGPTLSLDELKTLAVEGSRNLPGPSGGEGHYVSLPLEGRVDLMRLPPSPEPKHEPPASSVGSESQAPSAPIPTLHAPTAYQPPPHVPVPTHEYPTSAVPERPPSPPLVHWNPAIEPPPTTFVPNPTQQSIGEYYPNVWDIPPSSQHQRQHSGHHHPSHDPHHHPSSHHHQHHHHHHRRHDSHHHPQQQRHPPPPPPHHEHHKTPSHYHLVPPSDPPARHRTPSLKPHQFFPVQSPPAIPKSIAHEYTAITATAPNISKVFPWENKPRARPGRVFPDGDAPIPALSYQTQREASPQQPTVPLENDAMEAMRLVGGQPPSEALNQPLPPPITADGPASPVVEPKRLYEPGEREPGTLVYANAWDNIRSIQRYVSKLVKPPSSSHLSVVKAGSPTNVEGRRSPPKVPGSAEGRAEEEAEYGDDEEDTDEEPGHETPEPGRRGSKSQAPEGSASPSSRGSRSRGGSITSGWGKGISAPGARVLRSQGVQTTPKSRSHVGVQVSIGSPVVAPAPTPTQRSSVVAAAPVTPVTARNASIAASAPPIRTTPTRPSAAIKPAISSSSEVSLARIEDAAAPSVKPVASFAFPQAQFTPTMPPAGGPQDRGMLDSPIRVHSPPDPSVHTSRRGAAAVPQSPASPVGSMASHGTTGSTVVSPTTGIVMRRQRASSNATDPTLRASWMSTSSSATIVEPVANISSPEGVIVQPRATRKFDPARGVDVFKRDSQEVLARFLRMGPWAEQPDEGNAAHSTV